ncbi:MAG TPA: SDR family oxidoreductase [Aliidongia sp.]|uniref:SDR family NAD(P)-dependent oxidoreductase n=1 Tax=Aliidongia sp. TaxID=1914230 RepID=UPI002DDC9E80|nr:SDR family oxidoreductase [Aliidongia sp.]HEV2676560.1 SDR family oxidoreductase [Aliidongia sp.]
MSNLTGKVALVTGGSRGIGAAIARRLAADGADVALTFVKGEREAAVVVGEIEALGRRALAIRADNISAAQVEAAVAATAQAFGRLDILVNNAGIFRRGTVDVLTIEDFDATIAVNLRAAFVAAKAAAAIMGEGGRIVSIGSNLAVSAPNPGISLYTASKAALVGLSQGLARDLGPRGITVNVVHPGSTDTDMNPADGPASANQRSRMATTGGFADPAEIARVVAFLASPEARSVTGAAWTIDNGANA